MYFLCALPTESDFLHLTYVSQSDICSDLKILSLAHFIVNGKTLEGVFLLWIKHIILIGLSKMDKKTHPVKLHPSCH